MEHPRAGSNFQTFIYCLQIFNTWGLCGCAFVVVCFQWTGCNQVLASIWYAILGYQSVIAGQARGTEVILFATGGTLKHCQYEYQCKIHLLGRHQRYLLSTDIGTNGAC